MQMKIAILSLFPDYFKSPFDQSILKQAQDKGILTIRFINIRDFADNKHQRVDDRCYGGGSGMVLMAPPVAAAIRSVKTSQSRVIYMTPRGIPLTPAKCQELARCEELVFLCGHYEGIDERVLESEVDEEISIGDYVLTNGCLATLVTIDALARFIPGVLGGDCAAEEDSFQQHLLEHPHYTRPPEFEGKKVPSVLLEGHHEQIKAWRREQELQLTQRVRPELFIRHFTRDVLSDEEDSTREKNAICLTGSVLLVSDVEKSVVFYKKILGAHIEHVFHTDATLIIGNVRFALRQAQENENKQKQSVIFKLEIKDPQLVERFALKAKKSQMLRDFGLDEKGNYALIEDLDGYYWSLSSNPIEGQI